MGGSTSQGRNSHVEFLLDRGFDVMRRRAAGEQITVAQNYFEMPATPVGPSSGPVAYAELGPGATASAPGAVPGTALAAAAPPPVAGAAAYLPSGASGGAHIDVARAMAEADAEQTPHVDRMRERAGRAHVVWTRDASGRKKKESSTTGAYLVQVGSFRKKAEARDWLKDITHRFEEPFTRAHAQVITAGGWYRTRFAGLTESAAAEACRELRAHHLACMVMRPS
jgi:D-alanyl-D-alanine carboxypeptidase (penicillin-binding protein 5/6)